MRSPDSPPKNTPHHGAAQPADVALDVEAQGTKRSGEFHVQDVVDPLNVIVGFASMLADVGDDLPSDVRHRYAVRVRDAAEALQRSMAARVNAPEGKALERSEDWPSSGTFRVAARAAAPAEEGGLPPDPGQEAARPRVFLVDADEGSRELLAEYLGGRGYELIPLGSGDDALSQANRCPPDLVVIDPRMPGEDGLALVRMLKASNLSGLVPVVLVTTRLEDDARDRARDGVDQRVAKPVNRHELRARVKGLLELRAHREELLVQNEQLKRLQRFKDETTVTLVQDLRGPLTAILMNLDFALQDTPSRSDPLDTRLALAESRAAGTKVARRIANLLDIARIDDGRLVPKRTTVDVDALFQHLIIEYTAEADAEGLVIAAAAPGISLGTIEADADLVRRILGSLVENVLRCTDPGGHLELAIVRTADRVELRVGNDGASSMPSVDGHEGVARGMGLYFCQVAALAHGGRLVIGGSASDLSRVSFGLELPHL